MAQTTNTPSAPAFYTDLQEGDENAGKLRRYVNAL